MNGRYLIIKNNQEEELLYDIADFFWNNGNEVIVQGNFYDDNYYSTFLRKKPCVITIDENDFSENQNQMVIDEREIKYILIHFSTTGVYTNLIPFPHRIFQFERLDKSELHRFFDWCVRLNLFSVNKELKLL